MISSIRILLTAASGPFLPLLIGTVAVTLPAQLIVSELYRDPPGTESSIPGGASHEFVEIINLGPDTAALDALYLTNGIEADSVVPETAVITGHENCRYGTGLLAPGTCALILDPDYRKAVSSDSSSCFNLPDSTVLLRIGDSEFGSSGLAADHGVMLYRGTRTRIDSVLCIAADNEVPAASPAGGKITLSSPRNREGISLTAINVLSENPSFDYCPAERSPGVFEPLNGGWITEYRFGRFDNTAGNVICSLAVRSTRNAADGPVGWNLTRSAGGTVSTVLSGTLSLANRSARTVIAIPVDSAQLRFTMSGGENGTWDIDLSPAWLPDGAIRITEIFPKAPTGETEWFELENHSSMAINLKGWQFGTADDTVAMTETAFILKPGTFTVVTKNAATLASWYRSLPPLIVPTHWIALNDSHDTLQLFDAWGTLRETACYNRAWFAEWPYTSLERNGADEGCSAGSWSPAARTTPGLPNEALFLRSVEQPSLDIGPIPFTPDNDGSDDRLAIRLRLPPDAEAVVSVYGFDGRKATGFSGPPRDVLYWDGRGGSGQVPPGPFFVVAEIKRGGITTRIRKKGILWRK